MSFDLISVCKNEVVADQNLINYQKTGNPLYSKFKVLSDSKKKEIQKEDWFLAEDGNNFWLVVSTHLKKYARQIGNLPQIGVIIKNICETT